MNAALMSDVAVGSLVVALGAERAVRGLLRALCDPTAAVLPSLLPPTPSCAMLSSDAG